MEVNPVQLTQTKIYATLPLIAGVFKVRGGISEYKPGRWRVRIYFKGERFEWYSDFNQNPLFHPQLAQRVLEHINSLIDQKKFDPDHYHRNSPYQFHLAMETYLQSAKFSPEWDYRKRRIAEKFLIPHFLKADIREIRKIDIDNFLLEVQKKPYKGSTVKNIIGVLKAFFHFHRESIPMMPSFPQVKTQQPVIRWLTPKQQDEVFFYIPERDRSIFTFMRYSACRPNEARGLLRENVFLKEEQPCLVLSTTLGTKGDLRDHTKTHHAKVLPIVPEITNCLKPRELGRFVFTHRGRPYSYNLLFKIWKRANQQAAEEKGTPLIPMYSGLKHSLGVQRLNQGFSLSEVGGLMGHQNSKTTRRYAEYLTESLAKVMSGKK
jgi:integrase